jgi:CubicO group peptidase (beta-lactamase class C family)
VRHLFTYTSGLGYAVDWPKSFGMNQREILDNRGTIADAVRKLVGYPLLSQPGAKWRYGFSSDVLGRVAEIASGEPLNQFLESRLFRKIGMTSTGYWLPADKVNLLAKVYGPSGEEKLADITAKAPPSGPYTQPGTLFSAGGGLVSTAPDYLRFCQMILNGGILDGVRVLKPETVKAMITRQTTPEQGLVYWYDPKSSPQFKGYAWGLAIGVRADEGPHTVPGSPGDVAWGGLANTAFFIDPREKLAAVAMAQYLGPDEPALATTLRKGVYAALGR